MKIQWPRWFTVLWIALALNGLQAFLFFWVLEAIGEWSGLPGVSTLSSWLVSNWGPVILTVLTLAISQTLCGVLIWHWWDVYSLQQRKNRGS